MVLPKVYDSVDDGCHGAELRVSRLYEANKLAPDAVLLVCKFQANKVGVV
jgi:hypothetical protein